MAKMERVREEVSAPPASDYWKRKTDAGWRLRGWPVLTIVGGRIVHERAGASR